VRTRPSALVAAIALLYLAVCGCAAGTQLAGAASGAPPSGSLLLARRCEGCHARPEPAEMTRAEWLGALADMQGRFHLPDAEWDSLAALAPPVASGAPGGSQ
jgi:hypothetical protein